MFRYKTTLIVMPIMCTSENDYLLGVLTWVPNISIDV